MMKRIVFVILFAALPASSVFAQAGAEKTAAKAPAAKAAAASGIQERLIKMENDWAAAASKKDIDTVSGMLADDWTGIGMGPDPTTKAKYLADYKSGTAKIDPGMAMFDANQLIGLNPRARDGSNLFFLEEAA